MREKKTDKCVCGKRIMRVDGEWHHVWWKRDQSTGRYVINGCRFCTWEGEPPITLRVATPAAEPATVSGATGGGSGGQAA